MEPYMEKLLKIAASMEPGTLASVEVSHDQWCSLLLGRGECDCNPEIEVKSNG